MFGKIGMPSGRKFQNDREDLSSRSTRRTATVTIAGAAASSASFMSSKVLYFPVPKMRREE